MYVKRFGNASPSPFGVVAGLFGAIAATALGSAWPASAARAESCAAAWSSDAVYTGGNVVSEGNVNYVANWWTQGDDPATHNGAAGSGQPWTSQGSCSGDGGGTPTTGKVCFYEDADYGGASLCTDTGSSWVGTEWNDRVSSLKVQAGSEVQLFQDIDYGGASITVAGDVPSLAGQGFDDAMSSFKVQPSGGGGNPPPQGFVFSPYKDVTVNLDWNTSTLRTAVTGSIVPLVGSGGLIPGVEPNLDTVTLAFATGQCGSENWGGVSPSAFVSGAIAALDAAGVYYIVGTGGAAGAFKCGSGADLEQFIARYHTAHMIGVDFDIEGGQSQADIEALVAAAATAQASYPDLRFSFTLATLAASDGSYGGVNVLGDWTVRAIQASNLTNYTINLMVMDYGNTAPYLCVVSGGSCDMGQSAIQAAENLRHTYGIAFDHIELTPMIGQNDTLSQIVYLADVDTITGYAVANGLAGLHYWSLDRDTPCAGGATGYASPTCNGVSGPAALEYTDRFLHDLGF